MHNSTLYSDKELLLKIAEGDQVAFSVLFSNIETSYKPARTYTEATNRLLPFPQKQIDNSNGSIKQNLGYLGPK